MKGREGRAPRYTRRLRRFRARAEMLGPRSRRLRSLSGLTLLMAVVAFLAVLLGEAPPLALLGVLGLLAAFAVLLARHARLQKAEEEAWRWWRVNESAERRCRDAWKDFPDDGAPFGNTDHPHTSDLDVFGPGSLFQLHDICGQGQRASRELERLDAILGWMALRDSEWGHAPINVLLAWDIRCVVALERWQRDSGRSLRGWLTALGEVEALSSLAGAADDNPDFTFPELVEGPAQLSATGLGHPLLAPGVRVGNDVQLPAPGHALLVTGSNMSGKSTLLRSLGLASVMAYAGGPVCAAHLRLTPLAVHTSLRVADSVSEGVSRFYAELQRLRAMLSASRGALPVLFLIDEVLAGTNSVERGIGARWLLAELLGAGALGAISTHDAALCQLPAALMGQIKQAHFREGVDEGALVFDYRLREGPVRAGNALRLMRSLGLAIP